MLYCCIALRFGGYLLCSIIMAIRQIGHSNRLSDTVLKAVLRLLLAFLGSEEVALEGRNSPQQIVGISCPEYRCCWEWIAKVTLWGTDPVLEALCGFGVKSERRKPTSLQVMGRSPAGHSKESVDGSTILRNSLCCGGLKMTTNSLPHLSSRGEVYFPSSCIWAGSVTCSDW